MPLGGLPIPPGLSGDLINLGLSVDYSSRLVFLGISMSCLSVDYLSRLVLLGMFFVYPKPRDPMNNHPFFTLLLVV